MQQQLLPFLYRLALTPDKKNEELIREYEGLKEEVKKIANDNKMMVPILQLEQSMGLHEDYTERVRNRAAQDELFAQVAQVLNENGVRYIHIKGNAMKNLYPEGCPRQMGDYDLVVPSVDDFWKLIALIEGIGFDYQNAPAICQLHGEVVGAAGFYKRIDENTMLELEVSIGSFVMGEVSWLSGDFWSEARTTLVNGVKVPIPSAEDMILILTGESVGNKIFRLRDAVDLYLLLEAPNLDYVKLHERLKGHHLNMEFYQLVQYYEQVSGQKANIPDFMLEGFSNRLFVKQNVWRKRLYHYIPYNVDNGGLFNALLLEVLNIYRNKLTKLVSKREKLKLVRFFEKLLPTLPRYKLRMMAHLIPVPSGTPGEYAWVRLQGKMVVRSPVGWYVTSCFGLETREELLELDAAIAQHCAASSGE
ncbi:hypothetical protein CIG75_11120 [Tumebacillus algifaecis]|uniref:Nucleotidyltransferase n=1 Tax=Tumebacillus algifaecis TaxID=1214604 RepID=A0A223D1Z5_9BACL|nr:nucleotidyltransferase family protein [Tumebacillus algifaecis]ASS75473.1 hypothetical protein CIG75_11120 [Tumebacillus algifaecis]